MGGPSASAGDGGFQQGPPKRSTLSKRNQAKADKKSRAEANVEMGLGNDRMSNYSTNEGGTREGGGGQDNNNSNITQATKVESPTVETKVEKAADLNAEQILLRNKKRGRSMTMMSGAKGVTKTSSDYSLGKKSLLGIV